MTAVAPLAAPPLVVRVAATEAERQAAYRLRYEVYTVEHGDARYAAAGMYRDHRDEVGVTTLLGAWRGEELVGTMRTGGRIEVPFIAEEVYPFAALARELGEEEEDLRARAFLIERGAVHRDARRGGIYASLVEACHRVAVTQGAMASLGVVIEGHEDARRNLMRLGYRPSGLAEAARGVTGESLIRDLRVAIRPAIPADHGAVRAWRAGAPGVIPGLDDDPRRAPPADAGDIVVVTVGHELAGAAGGELGPTGYVLPRWCGCGLDARLAAALDPSERRVRGSPGS